MRTRALRTQPDDERKRRRDAVPSSVRDALRTPGEPLDRSTRELMEARFRFDFGHIRVHRDERASDAAGEIDAAAFTIGRHIVLGENVAPSTPHGRVLMAHELAHSSRDEHPLDALRLGSPHDVEETHANRAAVSAVAPPPHGTAQPVVRRTGTGAAVGTLVGAIGGAAIGATIGMFFGPLGAGIGALIGAVAGGIAGGFIGHAVTEPGAPMHLETVRATDLVTDPTGPTHMVLQRLPAGTRLAPADVAVNAPTAPNHVYVRVTTGPFEGESGWVLRADVVSRGLTDTLTMEQVADLYSELASATFVRADGGESPIPFHYPSDGCYARAQRMADLLTEKGYASEKLFAVSRLPGQPAALHVATPYGVDPSGAQTEAGVNWWYHVAPIVNRQRPDGTVERIVLDPSTQDGPVTVDEWIQNMSHEQFTETTLSSFRSALAADAGWTGSVYFTAPRSAYMASTDNPPPGFDPTTILSQYSDPEHVGARELASRLRRQVQAHGPLSGVLAAINGAEPGSRAEVLNSPFFSVLRSNLQTEYGPGGWAQIEAALSSSSTGGP